MLAYERHGSGPPLVLLHGVGHRRQAWDAVLDLLTPHRDLILADLPGHGESPPLHCNGRNAVEAMSVEILDMLDKLGLRRPHIAGNSLGGVLALLTAVQGRAATVTALSPAGFWPEGRPFRHAKVVFEFMQLGAITLKPVTGPLSRNVVGRAILCGMIVSRPAKMSPEQAAGDAAAFLAARPAMNAILDVSAPFTERIPADIPVTIAWGTRDRILPPRQARIAQQRLPDATYITLPGCGHVPMTDNPALVAKVLLEGSTPP
jgi:pimeloyl-ACP methyl ester carboxylesterase